MCQAVMFISRQLSKTNKTAEKYKTRNNMRNAELFTQIGKQCERCLPSNPDRQPDTDMFKHHISYHTS